MIYSKYLAVKKPYVLVIDEDNPDVGWYLYVWKDRKLVNDFLQDTLDISKELALEKFDISYDLWKKIPENTNIDFKKQASLEKLYGKL